MSAAANAAKSVQLVLQSMLRFKCKNYFFQLCSAHLERKLEQDKHMCLSWSQSLELMTK